MIDIDHRPQVKQCGGHRWIVFFQITFIILATVIPEVFNQHACLCEKLYCGNIFGSIFF